MSIEDTLFEQLVHEHINDAQYKQKMDMKDFQVGARVQAKHNIDGVINKGQEGTICHITGGNHKQFGVQWDKESSNLHNCQGHSKNRHGWYVISRDVHII